jgi:predicted transposase YbfD/YdcC
LALGQRNVDGKSNEISALPELLALLTLAGCSRGVWGPRSPTRRDRRRDALPKGDRGSRRRARRRLCARRQGQPEETLLEDIQLLLEDPLAAPDDVAQTVDGDHGRIETRRAAIVHDVAWLAERHGCPRLAAAGKVEATHEIDGKTTTACRYYVLSTPLSATRFLDVVRAHWHVENRLHWVLDVIMDEDQSRARKDNAPENLARLRRFALKHPSRQPGQRLHARQDQARRLGRCVPPQATRRGLMQLPWWRPPP